MPRSYSYMDKESYSDAIIGELARSYGYGRNESSGQYEFSFANVAKAYEKHPFWTAFDHLTVVYGPARLGIGAYSVTKGAAATGAVGKALSGGYFAKAGRSRLGEVYQAAKTLRSAPAADTVLGSRTLGKARQFLESPLKHDKNSDYWKLVNTPDPNQQVRSFMQDAPEILYGHDLGSYNRATAGGLEHGARVGDPEALKILDAPRFGASDIRGTAQIMRRERKMSMAAIQRRSLNLQGQLAKLAGPEQETVSRLLEMAPQGGRRAMIGPEQPGLWSALGEGAEQGLHAKMLGDLTPEARSAYQRSFDFRNSVHEEAFRLNKISEETYIKNYHRYMPHKDKRYVSADPSDHSASWGGQNLFASPIKKAEDRFRKRLGTADYVLDPRMQIEEVGNVAMMLAQHRYGEALARSIVAQDEARIVNAFGSVENAVKQGWKKMEDIIPGRAAVADSTMSRLRRERAVLERAKKDHLANVGSVNEILASNKIKLTGMESASYRKLIQHELAKDAANLPPEMREVVGKPLGPVPAGRVSQRNADLIEEMGRTHTNPRSVGERVSKTLAEHGEKISGRLARKDEAIAKQLARQKSLPMMKNVPDALVGKYIDPLAAKDLATLFSDETMGAVGKIYHGMQAAFKLAHTAYSPATQVRNALGGIVFHSMANGGFHSPHVGATALYNWTKGTADEFSGLVEMAVSSGVLGGSRNAETMLSIKKAIKGAGPDATGMDWVGRMMAGEYATTLMPANTMRRRVADRLAGGIQKSAAKAESLYGAVDEVYKLDTFIRQRAKLSELGVLSDEELTAAAAQHVAKYFPNYAQSSALVEMAAPHIPFMSFGTEAVRVFSNVLREKPQWAFFWSHIAESASQAFGAMADIDPSEQEAAKAALPWYTQGKKMLMLPWRDNDGKPHFLDLSYIIPMADMGAEAEQAERSFFGIPVPQVVDPMVNPVIQIVAGAATGVSPFTGRPITPRFTEEQMGIYFDGNGERFFFGMGEHILRTMLPPLVPPAYAGVNIMEALRQTKSGYTNRPLEENVARTLAMNMLGMRTYEPTVAAQLVNVKHEQRMTSEATTHAWDQYEMGVANGNLEQAERARARIIELKNKEYGPGRGQQWFEENVDSHQPGGYSNVSGREIEEIAKRSSAFNVSPTELAPLYHRLQKIRKGGR